MDANIQRIARLISNAWDLARARINDGGDHQLWQDLVDIQINIDDHDDLHRRVYPRLVAALNRDQYRLNHPLVMV